MNRTILAIATALLSASTLLASAAQACISCEYTPEVVNTPVRGQSAFQKKRTYVAVKEIPARPAKKKPAKVAVAKAEPANSLAPKKVETAKADAVQTKAESKPVETASLTEAEVAPAAEEQKVAGALTCKKFIPTAGMTVTVPCE